jgi:hypothetical protein
MTNSFLKDEINKAIENIQPNVDILENCSKLEKPRPFHLAAYNHHQSDVRMIFENGLRYNIEGIGTRQNGQHRKGKLRGHERGTTLKPHQRNQHRADSPRSATHKTQNK